MTEEDILLLEHILALHELGTIPNEYATFFKKLARTHELGLVANIWSKKALWQNDRDGNPAAIDFVVDNLLNLY
jgi:hypothetical protein